MEFFNDAMVSGLCKQITMVTFMCMLSEKIQKFTNALAYTGINNTPVQLKLIGNYSAELQNIHESSPDNSGYPSLWGASGDFVFGPKLIDFTSYFYTTDILSIPIVFNGISNQTGIYKLSCVCDKSISFTIGLTNRGTFSEEIYDRTYSRCFWPQDIFDTRDLDLISISNEGHSRVEGNLRIHAGESKISESVKLNNTEEVNLTIIWDSYQHAVYFYENERCIEKLCFEETDTEFVPFIYLYYDRVYEKSDCLVSLGNTKIQFR